LSASRKQAFRTQSLSRGVNRLTASSIRPIANSSRRIYWLLPRGVSALCGDRDIAPVEAVDTCRVAPAYT
jgi:hypothetical protein